MSEGLYKVGDAKAISLTLVLALHTGIKCLAHYLIKLE